MYGAALPTLTASYTGFVNGDSTASLTTLPTLSTTATAASHVPGNPYAITASGAVDPDYTITYVSGHLTVNPAPLTITANNQAKAYGAAPPTLTASYSGLVNGDTPTSLIFPPMLTTNATAASHVAGSPYTINASGAFDPDYTISDVPGSLAVTSVPLTITANNQTKAYGAALPTLTASYTGFVNGDTATSLTTPPTLTTPASTFSDVAGSPYAITASGAVDPDYAISDVPGNLSVTPAPLTITADNLSKVYGAAVPTLTGSVLGVLNGDDVVAGYATPATPSSDVVAGGYPITVSGLSGAKVGDYAITDAVPGTLTVTPAPLTVTANAATKVYGHANPTFTASYGGFVLGQAPSVLSGVLNFSTPATVASHVGTYPIPLGGLTSPDYAIQFVNGSLGVTPAPLVVTAPTIAITYGQAVPTLSPSFSGFVNGDTAASLATAPTLSTAANSSSHVGTYPIVAGGASSGDYAISYANGTVGVTPATLTVTPQDQVKPFVGPLPLLTATYSGLVNGDTPASLTTPLSLSTTATPTSAAGLYPIIASGGASPDYTIVDGTGTLTVEAPIPSGPALDPGAVAFVTSLYRDLLGRATESAGLVGWTNHLSQGMSHPTVARGIFNGSEAKAFRAHHHGHSVSLSRALANALKAEKAAGHG